MTAPRWTTHKEATDNGWFSRRHQTDAAHRERSERNKRTWGKAGRRARAAERKA